MGMIIDQINLFSLTHSFSFGAAKTLDSAADDYFADAETLDGSFASIMEKLNELIDEVWIWVIVALAAVVVVWGAWIGIKIAIANKNEEKINSRDMLKNLLIGVIVIFVVAMGVPLIIKALYAWAGV